MVNGLPVMIQWRGIKWSTQMKLQGWNGPNTPYLILHSEHRGDLNKPWQVVRCWSNNDEQDLLFEGARDDAMVFLKNNWECNNS